MNSYDAYKNTNHKCKNERTAETNAFRMTLNDGIKKILDGIEKIKLSENIMQKEEAMEILTNMSRGKLTDLMTIQEGVNYDKEGNEVTTTYLTFDKDALNDPKKNDILQEYHLNDNSIKVKTYNRVATISQLAELAKWNEQEANPDKPAKSFNNLRERIRKRGSK